MKYVLSMNISDGEYYDAITEHYKSIWQNNFRIYLWDQGPIEELSANFRVLEFPPTLKRNMWTYATVGMSALDYTYPIEVHLFSVEKDDRLVELLQMVAFFHKNRARLNLHHTVNFGKSWQGNSQCKYGYISLPYLDGPPLESFCINDQTVNFYWLIPVTEKEVAYKIDKGVEELENLFDKGLDYLDSHRTSLV